MMRIAPLLLAGLAGLGLAGCQNLECAEGTFSMGGVCVGFNPDDDTVPVTTVSPTAGRSREAVPSVVKLTASEPSRIYFTTDGTEPDVTGYGEASPVTIPGVADGTTIKFFAVDPAGNREDVQTAVYSSDTTPPGRVQNLAVVVTGTGAALTWTNPTDADFRGTLLARVTDVIDGSPTQGQMYTGAEALTPRVQLIAGGSAAQHADTGLRAGQTRYVAWTYDDLGNYSEAVSIAATVPIGSLAATFTYDTATGTLALTQAPPNLDLTTSTAAYAGTTLTLSLKLKNGTNKFFQNPKAEVTAVANGTFSNASGTADTFPFRTLGPNVLAPDATAAADLVFTNVTAGATATIDLVLGSHPYLITGSRQNVIGLTDSATGQAMPKVTTATPGPSGRAGRIAPSHLVNGHLLDIATSHATIERWDLVTQTKILSADLKPLDKMSVQAVIGDGTREFAVVKLAGRRNNGFTELLRLDEGLNVTGRLELPFPDVRGVARIAFAADGTIAIPLTGGVLLVDGIALKLIDADPSTPQVDPVPVELTDRVRSVSFFNGSSGMVVMGRSGGEANIIKRTANGIERTVYQVPALNRGFSSATAPDGRVWMGFEAGLRVYDPVTDLVSPVTYTGVINGLAFVNNMLLVVRSTRTLVDVINTAGAVQRTITVPDGAYGHWIVSVP